jgi:hypothetical protein
VGQAVVAIARSPHIECPPVSPDVAAGVVDCAACNTVGARRDAVLEAHAAARVAASCAAMARGVGGMQQPTDALPRRVARGTHKVSAAGERTRPRVGQGHQQKGGPQGRPPSHLTRPAGATQRTQRSLPLGRLLPAFLQGAERDPWEYCSAVWSL